MPEFKLHASYQPTGDQPQAIEALVEGFRQGNQCETLLGVTGSGKTFTMANVIAALNKPTLIIAHNKTLAGQLYGEFKEFFPENAVEYFVSYYDYHQRVAQIPEMFQSGQQFVVVPLVQADAGLVQDIAHPHQAGADLGSQTDPLCLAAGKCGGTSGQRQVIQSHIQQEFHPGPNLL